MREIIISIKPKYCSAIYRGQKTVELRKKIGSEFLPGNKLYIYSSTPVKCITGEASIKGIISGNPETIKNKFLTQASINEHDYDKYFEGSQKAFAIHLEKVIEYVTPLPLSTLKQINFRAPQSFCYATEKLLTLLWR